MEKENEKTVEKEETNKEENVSILSRIKNQEYSKLKDELEAVVAKKIAMKVQEKKNEILGIAKKEEDTSGE